MSESTSKLLQEAILDANALKELAVENAKEYVAEVFKPRITKLIKAKLQNEEENVSSDEEEKEEEEDKEKVTEDEEIPTEEDEEDKEEEEDEEDKVTEDEEIPTEEDEEDEENKVTEDEEIPTEEDEEEDEDEEDLDLEEILKELESEEDEEEKEEEEREEEGEKDSKIEEMLKEVEFVKDNGDKEEEEDEEDKVTEDEEIPIDIEDDEEEEEEKNTVEHLRNENAKYKKAIKILSSRLNEVNLLNAKLLYSQKITKHPSVTESQKRTVINAMDRAKTIREVKLTYANLVEAFKLGKKVKSKSLHELKEVVSIKGASKTSKKTSILNEQAIKRIQKLAGIKKD